MKVVASFFGAVLALAFSLPAAEYRVQLHRPAKVGQQFQIVCEAQQTHKITTSAGPTIFQTDRTNRAFEVQATIKVLAVNAKGKISQASLAIASLKRLEGRSKVDVLPPGTTVNASAQEDGEHYTVNGKPVDGETRFALSLVSLLRRDDAIDYEAFGSETPRRIGESWESNVEPLVATFQKLNLRAAKEDLQGRSTLERVVNVGEVECLEIASKIYIKKLSPPLAPGLRMKRFFGSIRVSGKFPLDLSLGVVEDSIELSVDFAAEGQANNSGPLLTQAHSATMKRTSRMSYAK